MVMKLSNISNRVIPDTPDCEMFGKIRDCFVHQIEAMTELLDGC